ncbi:DUF2380 domain-containing protein [Methylobacter sp. Wu1]|uniref:DUF2380 domain-containing protein n=1 Tax=Methylobacter sp. Wu1 TaxID=3119359 RepID=UPI002F925BFE
MMKLISVRLISVWVMLSMGLVFSGAVHASVRIAVLNFELNDITSMPNTPDELVRTATFRPLLEQAISRAGDYEIIHITISEQAAANAGFGYLFKFHDVAAALARQWNADWVVVGQHSKPSFLFSYLMAYLVNVKEPDLSARYAIELKGTHEKVTRRGIDALAKKIHASINRM